VFGLNETLVKCKLVVAIVLTRILSFCVLIDEPKEIRVLYKRFMRLDRSSRGTISADDLLMIPEISMNPLASRLIYLFDRDAEDRINFKSFILALSIFNDHGRPDLRCKAIFQLFDINKDGFITKEDLMSVMTSMVGTSISKDAIEVIITITMVSTDVDGDGKISFEDFYSTTSMGNPPANTPWAAFTVPVKSSMRESAANQLASTASFSKIADEQH
jgi:Ca2+-binding EF-hand superfamily protein